MNRKIILSLFLLLAAALAYLVSGVVRSFVVEPATYILWVAGIYTQRVPQNAWWALLMIILVLLAYGSLRGIFKFGRPGRETEMRASSRAQAWIYLVSKARRSEYFKWQLARQVCSLAVEVIAEKARIDPRQAWEEVANGRLDLPAPVQSYLSAGLEARSFNEYTSIKKRSGPALDLDPGEVTMVLESLVFD